jgi:hypothetical protein
LNQVEKKRIAIKKGSGRDDDCTQSCSAHPSIVLTDEDFDKFFAVSFDGSTADSAGLSTTGGDIGISDGPDMTGGDTCWGKIRTTSIYPQNNDRKTTWNKMKKKKTTHRHQIKDEK